MKRDYYFIRVPGKFNPDDVVYKVSAGCSTKEQTKLALIKEYCKDCGLYFAEVSTKSDAAVEKLAESLFHKGFVSKMFLRMRCISVSECYRRIIDDSFSSFEENSPESHSYLHQLTTFSYHFLPSNSRRKAKKDCHSVPRKYLSQNKEMSVQDAMFSFGLILAVFLLCGWIEGNASMWWPGWF